MRPSLLKKLCCPVDKAELSLQIFLKNEQGEIKEGLLTCTQCKRYYPIIYGLPIMTPDEYREKALEAPMLEKWNVQIGNKEGQKFYLKE